MPDAPDRSLLVMYKPDGVRRHCSETETERITEAWNSVLGWLRGHDPDGEC